MPSQVFVSSTPALKEFLSSCKADGAKELADADSVDLDELYRFSAEHSAAGGTPVRLHEILADAEVVERKRKDYSRPDMTEVEKMRAQAEERKYQNSVKGLVVDPAIMRAKRHDPTENAGAAMKFATNFATQTVVAFVGAFILGYMFVETFIDAENFNAKMIAGAGTSFCTLLVEVLLLVVHEQKDHMIEEKREKEDMKAKEVEERKDKRLRAAASQAATAEGVADAPPGEPKPADEKQAD